MKPVGQPTRGKTALNRLRQVDTYILLNWSSVLAAGAPLVVDLGYGAYPWTALEMVERWRAVNPNSRLLGVEIDPERVAAALPYAEPGTIDFRAGGFNLTAVLAGEKARLIRAFNVLRQYEEAAVPDVLKLMSASLETGGVLIEGTSTPTGRLVAFDMYRKTDDLQHRELVFGTNFREPISVTDFQAILPKRLIHQMRDPKVAVFFEAWHRALLRARGRGYRHPRRQWVTAARILAEAYPVDLRRRILHRGFLAVRDALSTSAPEYG